MPPFTNTTWLNSRLLEQSYMFDLAMGGAVALMDAAVRERLTEAEVRIGATALGRDDSIKASHTIPFERVARIVTAPPIEDDRTPIKDYILLAFRSLIVNSYELIKNYCERTNQMSTFTSQPWYQFFRTIRNTLSHDLHFDVPKAKDGSFIESEWKGRKITGSLDGTLMPIAFLGYDGMYEMYLELAQFAQSQLK